MNIEGTSLLPISLNLEYKTVKGTIPKRDKINRNNKSQFTYTFFSNHNLILFFAFQLEEFIKFQFKNIQTFSIDKNKMKSKGNFTFKLLKSLTGTHRYC
ncbi:hypothetical protein LEP1GSC016_0954 [Leptospira borgpetersenii serovar Hardjo-bovis str. Sponselee]|uniref:Uncharacterized protein n=1 Tax=Leptospira borgpetersenii serovar Hardjo-bovis str. Sponselee TaxID=1303729 RepID=M6BZ77_LEPBO|nr:hypothetical protein LBK6_16015 [Leptospira borgpetersenii serovar Hardjo]AYR09905.1 hypothetical protein D1609_17300 [Leptospira borgpetersenii serovar Hardjo-bovis]EMJ79175.1 hypothetical protein LEP1GSC016_0954 [Leptospira borgpetersenii serovar Hardjo-bovis str. Sponselee]TQE51002.1 hypothetical protein FFZ95_16190 [Leptospira borgpetersenii]AMX62995.1 hypothetical protein LBK9_15930 [Leptospira borgpetersenii serovar Hardjo]